MFTDRRGPIVRADADAAYALAGNLARDTGKTVYVYRQAAETIGMDYLVTSEPAPDGWYCVNRALPPS
jgi:hypothetical protein